MNQIIQQVRIRSGLSFIDNQITSQRNNGEKMSVSESEPLENSLLVIKKSTQ